MLAFLLGLITGIVYCFLSLIGDFLLWKKGKSFAQLVHKVAKEIEARSESKVYLAEDFETPEETLNRIVDEKD